MLECTAQLSQSGVQRLFSQPSIVADPQFSPIEREALRECRKWMDIITGTINEELDNRRIIADTMDNYFHYVNKGLVDIRKSATEITDLPALEWTGQGSLLFDSLGREYIDCLGGYGLYSLGIRHPRVIQAVQSQLNRHPLSSQEYLDPLRGVLCKLLAKMSPGKLQYSFLINNGTDAVEGALKLARSYTGRPGFLSSLGGFHGKSMGSLSLLGKAHYRKVFEPLLADVIFARFGDAADLESQLYRADKIGKPVAAVVLEPVQGEAGAVVPPDDYWPKVRKACDSYDVLLIADEVQTGLGRTGRMFALEHWNVEPDILCLGKALGGGVVPLSAFVSTPKIWRILEEDPDLHSSTTGGNPLACAAGIAALQVTIEERLPEQAAAKGEYMLRQLQDMVGRYPDVVAEARGLGLLLGMQFTKKELGWRVISGLFRKGVLLGGTLNSAETVRLEPALNISYEFIDEVLNRLEDTLDEVSPRPVKAQPLSILEPDLSKA